MRALFIPEGNSFCIELIAETPQDRAELIKHWDFEKGAISCEEWRELSTEAKEN